MNPLNPSLLRAIRLSALCIFLFIFVPMVIMYASLLTHYDPEDLSSSRLQAAFIPFCLWFPYFWVFWRLRDSADAEKVKRPLAHAVSWGSVGALFASGVAIALWIDKTWLTAATMSLLALFQIVLLGSAIKAYYSLERKSGDLLILAARFGIIALVAIVWSHINLSSSVVNMRGIESSAADAVRTINAAQSEYAKTHPSKGFASSLKELGPTPGAGLIKEDLAGGRSYNYILSLSPSAGESSGRITRYTVAARPHPYGSHGRRSFYADESGVIHYTAADRAATVQDRVLPWM